MVGGGWEICMYGFVEMSRRLIEGEGRYGGGWEGRYAGR